VGNLGVVYDFLGEREKALIAFQDAHKLNPGNALVFSNVVTGYYQLNRFDEARATAAQADALHLNSNFLEANLYMVDFLQDNPSGMAKRVATLSGKPGSEDLIFYYQSDTAAYHGRFSEARAFTRRAIDSAERSDKKETAAAYEAESAVREALTGDFHLAAKRAKDALSLSNGKEVEALSAIALAMAGDATEVARLTRDLNGRFPQDTVVEANLLPTITLAEGLRRGDAARLTRALALPAPYELGDISNSVTFCMYSSYFRGDSYLASSDGRAAAAEFQKIVDHPGLVRNGLIGSLAHLGLGRAYVKTRDVSKAKLAYEDFFNLWKEADPDVPILTQAKAEYSRLN
jgi:tetratricopeptide (TPR) repeat protein